MNLVKQNTLSIFFISLRIITSKLIPLLRSKRNGGRREVNIAVDLREVVHGEHFRRCKSKDNGTESHSPRR